MAKVEVNPGVCGLHSVIHVSCEDGQTADIQIESECPGIKALGEQLGKVDAFSECFGKMCDSSVYQAASQHCKHPACPVPCAIIKGIEAACSLALPKDAEIKITMD